MESFDRLHQVRFFPVDSATRIDKGDMVWLDTDDVKPASDFTWSSDLATTQGAFAAQFVGIAMETSAVGETRDVPVSQGDLPHMMLSPSATYQPGATVGPDENPTNKLANQIVEAATGVASIGRVPIQIASGVGQRIPVVFASAYGVQSANLNAHVG